MRTVIADDQDEGQSMKPRKRSMNNFNSIIIQAGERFENISATRKSWPEALPAPIRLVAALKAASVKMAPAYSAAELPGQAVETPARHQPTTSCSSSSPTPLVEARVLASLL